ncbi:MAG: GxxExxY protein [Candidatus Magasanikiibacteriota bacterium]
MIDLEKYNKITYAVIGTAMEVHKELGCGFLENVYQQSMVEELKNRLIPFFSQKPVEVFYKDKKVAVYVPDFVAGNLFKIVVELKALETVDYNQIQMQIINYLVATKYDVGLFLNFGKPSLEYKRYVRPERLQKSVRIS